MNRRIEPLDRRIRNYAIAAASGAALLAPSSLHGAVVYHAVNQMVGFGQSFPISFNTKGVTDFTVANVNSGDQYYRQWAISLDETRTNHEIAVVNGQPVTAFQAGAVIGPQVTFSQVTNALLASGYSTSEYGSDQGPFAHGEAFAGVEIHRGSDTYYGWIRMELTGGIYYGGVSMSVIDYAYQTTPNIPIRAGAGIPSLSEKNLDASGSLGMLALGASAVGLTPSNDAR